MTMQPIPTTMKGVFSTTPTPVGKVVKLMADAPTPGAAVGQPYPGFIVVRTHAAAFNPVDKVFISPLPFTCLLAHLPFVSDHLRSGY